MADENPAPNQPEPSTDGSPAVQGVEPVDAPKTSQPQTTNELQDVKKELGGYERSTLRWTRIIVGINLLTCIFIGLQWHEMKSGSADTHTLAEQAKKQAENLSSMATAANTQATKMADVSIAAEKIRKAAEDMVAQDQRIADNAQRAMDASNKQNKAALDATIAASTLDQRAWIGIGAFRVLQFDKDAIKVDIEVRNSGKTPALSVSESNGYGSLFSLDSGPQESWFTTVLHFVPAEAIPPGGSHIMHLTVGTEKIAPIYESIKSKAYLLYVFGQIKYTDVSGKVDGSTDFCLFMSNPDTLDLGFCGTHNDMK